MLFGLTKDTEVLGSKSHCAARRLRTATSAIAALGCLLWLAPAMAKAASPISWGTPSYADRATPLIDSEPLEAVSCAPGTSFCAAIEQDRGVLWVSTDPISGASFWKPVGIPGAPALVNGGGISCPSTSLCVLVSGKDVFTSTHPTVARSWHVAQIDTSGGLEDVSCPSQTLCVAVDDDGNVFHSTNPAGGASAWSNPVAVGLTGGEEHISCPASNFCAESGFGGSEEFLTTSDPTGGASAWKSSSVDWHSFGLSCASSSLCVSIEQGGIAHTTIDPGDPTPSWSSVSKSPSQFESVSCSPDAAVCAIGGYGKVWVSTTPATSWTGTTNLTGSQISGMSCPTSSLCVGVSHDGNAYTSATPSDAGSWSQALVDDTNPFTSLACTGLELCVATDAGDRALDSSQPGSGSLWNPTSVVTPSNQIEATLTGLSCVSSSFCAAVYNTSFYTSTNPGGPSPTWNGWEVDPNAFLRDTSCPSKQFCAAVGGRDFFTTSDPADANPEWTKTSFSVGGFFAAVSCPTAGLCVWVANGSPFSSNSEIFTWTSSASGTSWNEASVPGRELVDVSCASASLCGAVDANGTVLLSTHPTGGAAAWTAHGLDTPGTAGGGYLSAISCASALCTVLDDKGNSYTTADAAAAHPTWSEASADPGVHVTAVSCWLAAYRCVAVDQLGQAVLGTVAKETLTVKHAGGGSGTVSAKSIHCPHACSVGYPAGTQITLTAHPAAGSLFKGWSGACTGAGACTVTMTANQSVVATFVKKLTPPHGTKITSASVKSGQHSATFKFKARGTIAGFKCALVKGSSAAGGHFSRCSSPKAYTHLAAGKHTFVVEAYNRAGADPHPASRTFTIG